MSDERILDKLDKMDDRLNHIDITLVKQEENLKEHMRRTLIAEESIEVIRTELKPVKKHIHMIEGGLKLLALVSLCATILKSFGLI
jgi:hypothetical protein